jgi:hypothetical protein
VPTYFALKETEKTDLHYQLSGKIRGSLDGKTAKGDREISGLEGD